MDILFAGNRAHVLQEMVRTGLRPRRIFAVKGSYLERELTAMGMTYEELPDASLFIRELERERFDLFLSNGCPILLPIGRLQQKGGRFINIHPSYLPDLRGVDPVPGALLHARDAGATCHLMDDGIDTGAIISQVRIPFSEDLDAGLLYQLSFIAEREVFTAAHALGFSPQRHGGRGMDTVYYTFKPSELRIDWDAPLASIIHRIKAFGTRSKGAWFEHDGQRIIVRDAEGVDNPFLLARKDGFHERQVVFAYEHKLLVRHRDGFLKLKDLDGAWPNIRPGALLA